jgi:hypothetical protein
MIFSKGSQCIFIFLILLIVSTFGQAAIIPLDDSGWAMIVNTNQVKSPYVYSVDEDAVVIELDKIFFGGTDPYGNLDPIVIQFQKVSEQASSTIVIRDEYIYNNTEYDWKDFHLFLQVGAVDPEAGFDSTKLPYGDQLETVSYSRLEGYLSLPIQLNFTTTGDGVSNEVGENLFNPGYRPGYDPIVIQVDPTLLVGESFGLKEVPTVPEPTTLLTLLAGLGLWWLKRK